MNLGGLTYSELFGGYEIVNQSATKLPQPLASALGLVNAAWLGATYAPLWYVGKQVVNGVNHFLICKELRATKKTTPMIVGLIINIPAGEGAEQGKGARIVRIIEQAEMPQELELAFAKATQQLIGVGYTPIAYVGSQVVRGVNHHFICQAVGIYPNAEPYAVSFVLNVFKDDVTVVSIEQL